MLAHAFAFTMHPSLHLISNVLPKTDKVKHRVHYLETSHTYDCRTTLKIATSNFNFIYYGIADVLFCSSSR